MIEQSEDMELAATRGLMLRFAGDVDPCKRDVTSHIPNYRIPGSASRHSRVATAVRTSA